MDIVTRYASRKDAKSIILFYSTKIQDSQVNIIESFGRIQNLLIDKSNKVIVAKSDNVICGFAVFRYNNSIRYPKPIVEILEVYIPELNEKQEIENEIMNEIFNFTSEKDSFYTSQQNNNSYSVDYLSNNFAYHYRMQIN